MPQTFKIKSSSVEDKVPAAGDLATAELALNLKDQKLYSKDADGNVFEIGQSTAQNLQQVTDEGNTTDNDIQIGTGFGTDTETGVTVGGAGTINLIKRANDSRDLINVLSTSDGVADNTFRVSNLGFVYSEGYVTSAGGVGNLFIGVELRKHGQLMLRNGQGSYLIYAEGGNGLGNVFQVDNDAHVSTTGGVTSVFGTSTAQVGNVAPLNDWSCYPARA